MTPWRTAIAQTDETNIRIRGYDIQSLMQQGTFAGMVFLLHQGRLPTADEARLLDAVMIGIADHGANAPSCAAGRLVASGNRQSFSAAVAAGVLAIGDEHGGAASGCMEMIAAIRERARRDSTSIHDAAKVVVADMKAAGKRLPGFGHRQHTEDPRVNVVFPMAREMGLAGDGIACVLAVESAAREIIKPLPLNIDSVLAAVLYDLGFPPAAGHLIFIIARVAGITAEVAEEHSRERPMRIRIPVEYDGDPPRKMP